MTVNEKNICFQIYFTSFPVFVVLYEDENVRQGIQ